uniref:Leucine rich repeat containing 9 n=1 Tax=Cynoglossus semilaevis TaxID=244447 RepID=A0A3P8UK33_CYNSE
MIHNERQKHCSDEDVLNEVCLANGVSYDKLAQEGSSISSLEMFFSGFPRMLGLSFFPGLCHLTIIGQGIENIEGLEGCPLLKELWVVQCQLTVISGLENCVLLEKLYLYENQISEITGLVSQVNLEVLWLNNNCIKHIEELTRLAFLPSLRVLALHDPTSTPNPVCLLCNYATHVLYHMPGLQRLDAYDVSSKQVKEAAEATVTKKMMYYNMRVRTTRRKLAETHFSLTERKRTLLQLPEECVRTLSHTLKNLERELSKVLAGGRNSACIKEEEPEELTKQGEDLSNSCDPTTDIIGCDPAMETKILKKIAAVKERLSVWMRRLHEIESCYKQEVAQATAMMDFTVHFLSMELESVGNIRLEEGCSTDPWFTSCCDLLLSRFSPTDYKSYGFYGIKIDRVVRILNSALRQRFEDKLHSLIDSEDSALLSHKNYRRKLDHLFYTPHPEKNREKEEILSILEEGFKTSEEFKVLDKDGAIPLTNSLNVSEKPRIERLLQQTSPDTESEPRVDAAAFKHSQIIVSKVFVGHSMPLKVGDTCDRSSHHTLCSVYRNMDAKNKTTPSDERASSNTTTTSESSCRRRQWLMFDRELVLPEYIVFFHYTTENQKQSMILKQDDASNNNIILDQEVLSMEPVLKAQPKLLSLDDKILLSVARANVLSQISVLNLHGNSLNKIKEISCLTCLRHLTISFNEFTRLDDISHMPNLEYLDASFNHLVTLEGLRGLGQLKQLDVRWNQLTKAREDATVLRRHAPALLKLDTRYNPWNRSETVRVTLLGRLTTLTHLDEAVITDEEAAEATVLATGAKIHQATILIHSRTNGDRPRSLCLMSTAQLLHLLHPPAWRISQDLELEPNWTERITALNLEGQRITKMTNLNKLVNLRWASFNNNDISKVEGLENCLKLEELSLNNNCITSFTGLSKLTNLHKLSMDGNQLSGLDASVLDSLPNLSFLSVDKNQINSLHGIQRVRSLLELYIGNNQISASRDIFYLKAVTNLIILDLYGNPLVEKLENYRIYVVFHLPSLKALDGIAVEANECESAKDMFGGRLTSDMVLEKLGHCDYTDITYLTLQSCSIRSVDLSPPDMFYNLCSVNLDHNNLTSFSGLLYLPNIKTLCLNHNHIESILPKQKTHVTNRQMLYNKVPSSGYGQQSPSKSNRETGPCVSLEPLMSSLEVLHLSHNCISNMANLQLSRLTNLKALFLQGNEISQVEGLEGLHQLRELFLDKNRIKTLSENSFISQNSLLELHLTENRIRELNHLDPLAELRKLFLGMNKLQDMAELEKLDLLPSLMELSVVGNPVARNSLHRPAVVLHLSQLQVLDGVTITLEERTRAELLSAEPPPCSQCSGVSQPPCEILLPGLFPPMTRNAPLRAMNISGLQSIVHGTEHVLPSNTDESPAHCSYRNRKHKHIPSGRSAQTDLTFRYVRRPGNSFMTPTGHLPDGNRVIFTYHNQEHDSRFPNGGKHPPL